MFAGRITTLTVAAAALSILAPAVAQAQIVVNDHRRKKPAPRVTATALAPETGPVGTRVTIRGSGFTPRTQVIFGRTRVKPLRTTPTSILLRVPDAYGDGVVVLRHPGVGGDIPVGRFTVDLPLQVTGFAPASGIAGTRVVVRGSGFRPGVQVSLGKTAATVSRVTPTRLTIVIPDGAGSAVLTVSAGANTAHSGAPFRVISRAPTLDAFSPAGGTPGSVVRITGTNIGPTATAHYGALPMAIRARGAGWVDAEIPAAADRDDHLWIRTDGGESRARSRFRLEHVPSIVSFGPTFGIVGQRVDIRGRHFRAGDRFSIDGRPMRVLQLRASRVSAVVPAGANRAPIVVERDGHRAASATPFEVLHAPELLRMEPAFGEAGTRVTLVGRNLGADTEVRYGQRKVRVLSRSVGKAGNDRLIVAVPKGADARRFRVRTRGGQAATSDRFQVHFYPVLERMTPQRGLVGTELELRGANLEYVQKVLLGAHPLRIVDQRRGRLVVMVTPGASDGTIRLVSFGQELDTRRAFGVFAAPIVTDMQPRVGVPGTEVVITGKHLRKSTRVYLDRVELPILRVAPDRQLTVLIPKKARSGKVFLGEGDARVAAPHPFVVLAAPTLTGFGPRRVKAGANVVLRGRDFTRTTEVVWGTQTLPVVARRGSRQIEINVPGYTAAGKAPLVLRQDGVTVAASRGELEVLAPPANDGGGGGVKIRDHRKKKKR